MDESITALGTFSSEQQQQIADGTYVQAIIWTPLLSNTDVFADDHPGTANNTGNHYLNLASNFTGVEIQANFTPSTAVYEVGAGEVELTALSTSSMGSNLYWAVGRHFGTNDNGTEVPQWTGTVKSRTTEPDGSFKIILTVDTGNAYLTTKAAQYGTVTAPNNIEQLFSTGKQFIVHESVSGLYLLDQITTAGEGYTIYGANTQADLIGTVTAGYTAQTIVDYIDVNYTIANFTLNNGIGVTIDDFNAGDVNTTNSTQLAIRLQNDGNTGYWGHVAGQANLFGQTSANGGRPFATNWSEWADLLLEAINTPADAPFSNPGISSNDFWPFTATKIIDGTTGTIRLTPKTGVSWSSTSYDTGTPNQPGFDDLTVVTKVGHVPNFLTLAEDPNRFGGVTGMEFRDDTSTSDWNTWGNISFARGATLELNKAFKCNIGRGYDWTGDSKDGIVTVRENAQLMFSYENRDDLWGGKGGSTNLNRTDANPMTVNKFTGGQILITDIITQRTGTGGGNWTFISGEYTAAQNKSLIFNTDNAGTGCYSDRDCYYYPMPGFNTNNQVVIDMDGYRLFYEVAPTIKQFDGDNIVFNKGDFLFNMNIGTYGVVANFDYASQCIIGDMDISGTIIDSDIAAGKALGGSTVRNGNLVLFDLTRAGTVYVGDWGWVNTGTGKIRLARRWNPSWSYAGVGLNKIIESYYYETNAETTLVEVKEGCESGLIGTAGTQNHPLVSEVTIGAEGLANVELDGVSSYLPDTDEWTSDKAGLLLSYLVGTPPTSGNHVDTLNEDHTTAYSYTRSHAFRPSFTSINLRDPKSLFSPSTSMDARLDQYWQAKTVAEIATLVNAITEGSMRVNANLQFVFLTSGVNNWNDLYRHIEHRENDANITGGSLTNETRAYDSVNNLNGRFRRIVDTDVPVSAEGLVRIIQGDTHLTMNTAVGISTDSNAISGVDAGAQGLFIDSASGVSRDMTGKFRTTGDISLAPRNLGSAFIWKNSEFNADELQITSSTGIGNATNNRLDNCTVNVNTLTFGGIFTDDAGTDHAESPSADYSVDNSTLNIVNAVTFPDYVDRSTINTNANVTFEDGSTENIMGSTSSRLGATVYSNSSGVSSEDRIHCTSVQLPPTVTNLFLDSTGAITTVGSSGTVGVSTIKGSGITLIDLAQSTVDGLANTVTAEDLSETTVTNASNVSVVKLEQSSSVTCTGSFAASGIVEDSTVDAGTTATMALAVSNSTIEADTSAAYSASLAGGTTTSPIVTVATTSTDAVINASTSATQTGLATRGTTTSPVVVLTAGMDSTDVVATTSCTAGGNLKDGSVNSPVTAVTGNVNGTDVTANTSYAVSGGVEGGSSSSAGTTIGAGVIDADITDTSSVVVTGSATSTTVGSITAPTVEVTVNVTKTNITATTSADVGGDVLDSTITSEDIDIGGIATDSNLVGATVVVDGNSVDTDITSTSAASVFGNCQGGTIIAPQAFMHKNLSGGANVTSTTSIEVTEGISGSTTSITTPIISADNFGA